VPAVRLVLPADAGVVDVGNGDGHGCQRKWAVRTDSASRAVRQCRRRTAARSRSAGRSHTGSHPRRSRPAAVQCLCGGWERVPAARDAVGAGGPGGRSRMHRTTAPDAPVLPLLFPRRLQGRRPFRASGSVSRSHLGAVGVRRAPPHAAEVWQR
jgi:hypothetical protein